MPIVRLSGTVDGRKDPNRKIRAKLLYRLYDAGWNIYNSNGDQKITLSNIQKKIKESDAFVFTPGATLEDMFKAASIFVGFQTNDTDLKGKTVAILNSDLSWDEFVGMIRHLHDLGTVHQNPEDFLDILYRPKHVVASLEESYQRGMKRVSALADAKHYSTTEAKGKGSTSAPERSVCVFCSASIRKEEYLQAGYDLGKDLAEAGIGCVSGAGRTGIMGQVVKGAVENGGWTAGSNVPHIIELEGLPEGLSEFWPRGDIYTRMEVMIERSDAFVAMPGGMGTVQEVMALLILKKMNDPLMVGKPIILYNFHYEKGVGFWDPLVAMLGKSEEIAGMYEVVDKQQDIMPKLLK